jgi:small-conductance mechanosensitive channel
MFASFALIAESSESLRDTAERTQRALSSTFDQLYQQTMEWTPKAIVAVVVLLVGYIIARLAGKLVATLATKLNLQYAAERGGLVESMKQVGIKRSVPAIFGTIVFWMFMLLFLMAAANSLGLVPISTAMNRVVEYIPNVLGALVVVIVGLLVASFLRGVVATSADRFGLSYAHGLAAATYYTIVVMTLMAGFAQLNIQFALLNDALLIVLSGASLAFGLAVGLGGRDVVSGIMAGYYLRQRIQSGDFITLGTLEGRVRDVGPVATIIETEEDGLMNRRSVPNTKMLHEAVR